MREVIGLLLAPVVGVAMWGGLLWVSPLATAVLAGLVVVGIPVWAVRERRRPLPELPEFVQHKSPKPLRVMPADCGNPDCQCQQKAER